jgi:hypothetical protein
MNCYPVLSGGNMKVSLFLLKQQEKKEDKSDKTEDEKN